MPMAPAARKPQTSFPRIGRSTCRRRRSTFSTAPPMTTTSGPSTRKHWKNASRPGSRSNPGMLVGTKPAMKRRQRGGMLALLTAPLILFVVILFLWPVARFLALAVDNSDFSNNLPRTIAALAGWKADSGLPGEPVFAALVEDLADARRAGKEGVLAQLVNQRVVGSRFLVIKTAKDAADGKLTMRPVRDEVLSKQGGWKNIDLWQVIARQQSARTDYYLLASLDLKRGADNSIEAVSADRAIFVDALLRTIWISIVVTVICAVLAVPLAQAIVSAPPAWSKLMFALILFPLWTSLLVRTVIWIIVLQKNGPVNSTLLGLGIVSEPLDLIYTRFSLYLAMVQVLLPMMVLSVVAVMRRVPTTYMRAALSLGAPWLTAWRRVQLPLILPGILSGGAIVFVFALGYYITPTLVGGPTDQMISSYIAFYTNSTLNWGMGAALSLQLLMILVLFALLFWTASVLFRRKAHVA
ncbi:ABC transporter permease [Mesorhizobium sp. M7A.T.Ca.TU.009.02.1.1]|nr:ABC transporter permease [Mesorhizobium sp. M7A.T.Ca.US.000.02.1.1]RUT84483.1 ABC transporter permease [Mesorhizobium sp. M7A.T.Ca.US.000.02.2.1]RUU01769.1 ABC transporter permease [Mesorhizobium sp. M7A.T.Ca.TU.009.02.1.1]RUU90468.1 ABC transporter permease [Mesorhizobium sp. M7A.T.Ca.TU.009.01.1.2]